MGTDGTTLVSLNDQRIRRLEIPGPGSTRGVRVVVLIVLLVCVSDKAVLPSSVIGSLLGIASIETIRLKDKRADD